MAIVGRPNVGKSTLFNRLIGEDRSVVHDKPGTTRDAVDTVVDTPFGPVRFVDTAGMRRRSRIDPGAEDGRTEYFSMVRALRAVDTADVALLVIDATQGVTHQDQRLAERVDAAGCPVVVLLNKVELLDAEARADISAQVADKLRFLGQSPVLKISALSGKGVHKLLPSLGETISDYHARIPTATVNRVIREAQSAQPAPHGARVLYATQGATDPPTFTLFTNRELPATYLRYLERRLREELRSGGNARQDSESDDDHDAYGPRRRQVASAATDMQTPFLVILALLCSMAAATWGRSARQRYRIARRVENLDNPDAMELSRATFVKDALVTASFGLAALASLVAIALGDRGAVAFGVLAVPAVASLVIGRHFPRQARLSQARWDIERRAEETLSQEELAPRRWAERLAPQSCRRSTGFELGQVYQAGTGLMAGDFYDVYPVSPTRLAAVIGDVTGHGIEASITAFQAKYLLRVFLQQFRDPAQAVEQLNAQMSASERIEEFISLCVVVFDTEAGTLRYASAGHPAAWLWHERDLQPLRATGPPPHARPRRHLLQPRGGPRRARPGRALHRRPGRGPLGRRVVRRGAHRLRHPA